MLARLDIITTAASVDTLSLLTARPWNRTVQFGDDSALKITFEAELEPEGVLPAMATIVASIVVTGKNGRSAYAWSVYSPRDASSQIDLQHIGDAGTIAEAYADAMAVVERLRLLPPVDHQTYSKLIARRRIAVFGAP